MWGNPRIECRLRNLPVLQIAYLSETGGGKGADLSNFGNVFGLKQKLLYYKGCKLVNLFSQG